MSKETAAILNGYGARIVKELRKNLVKSNRNASGRLSRSIEAVVTDSDKITQLTILANKYIRFLEFGRGATKNARGEGFTVDVIKQWIRDKGIGIPEGAAYAIYKKINKKGFKGTAGLVTSIINNSLTEQIRKDVFIQEGQIARSLIGRIIRKQNLNENNF